MAEEIRREQETAQETAKPETEPKGGEGGGNDGDDKPVTLESMIAEIAGLRAENAKTKAALDKALHNNGELTKQLRAKMTASEQEEQAKKEQEEAQRNRLKELEDFKKRAEARERYMSVIGMSADLAKEAAEAEVKGDMDALASVYKRQQDLKLKENDDEWNKRRPDPSVGHEGDKQAEDPFLVGFMKG